MFSQEAPLSCSPSNPIPPCLPGHCRQVLSPESILREIAYNWLLYLVETVIGRRFAFDKDYASKCDQQYENKFILGALAITRWDEAEESGTSASKCMAWQQRACHTSLNSLEDPEDPGGFYLTHHHVESRVFRMFGFLPDRHNARP
jgi:hypothetical protein